MTTLPASLLHPSTHNSTVSGEMTSVCVCVCSFAMENDKFGGRGKRLFTSQHCCPEEKPLSAA